MPVNNSSDVEIMSAMQNIFSSCKSQAAVYPDGVFMSNGNLIFEQNSWFSFRKEEEEEEVTYDAAKPNWKDSLE